MGEPISVFLVDDHAVVREGLSTLLSREPDLVVVGEAADAENALPLLKELEPTVIVLDQRLPGMSGVELCREIAHNRLRSQVVILSAFLERSCVEDALRAGARAYIVKDVDSEELTAAIRAAAEGKTTVDSKISLLFGVERGGKPVSPRHVRVLLALAEGHSVSAVGRLLGLSLHTVKSYMREIYSELGVNSRAEAIAAAARRGLI